MRTLARIAVIPLLALALTACGAQPEKKTVATAGGKQPAKTATDKGGSLKEKQLKWTKCMRENGVKVADPNSEGVIAGDEIGPDGGNGVGSVAEPGPKEKKALEKCREFMPQAGDFPKPSPEEMKKAREFAKCMRKNGVPDFADPDAKGDVAPRIDTGTGPNSEFEKALKVCQKIHGDGATGGIGVAE